MNKFLALSLLLVAAPVLAEENAPAAEVTKTTGTIEVGPEAPVAAVDQSEKVTRAIEVAPEAPAQKKQAEDVGVTEPTRSAEVTPEASAANQESN